MNKILNVLIVSVAILSNQLNAQIIVTTAYENDLRTNPDLTSSSLKRLPAHKDVILIDFIPEGQYGGYFKVTVYGLTGYIDKNSVNYDESYYLAMTVKKGNVNEIYLANRLRMDKLNDRKRYEEERWAKQNFKPISYQKTIEKTSTTKSMTTASSSSNISVGSPAAKVIQMKKMASGTYEIPCKVNGLALNFIFDTGASDVSISLTEALFMFKNGYLNENDIIGTESYSIANGDITEGTTIRIRKLEFGGLVLYNVDASIIHEMEAPLLLGQSAISRLGTIQIDPKKGTLTVIE
ncbi:retroviral-like aspartic protease family protein [Crocinitomix sp.]|nr:retroviral-like aspartic protease family protein [Crocinitomix sp.]